MQSEILSESSNSRIARNMLLRAKRRFANICAVFPAAITILLFAFATPGTHEPKLPAAEYDTVSSTHSHAHDGHSHDEDLEITEGSDAVSDHHHADHAHEKAGVMTTAAPMVPKAIPARFSTFATRLAGSPPDSIDLPPRHETLS